MRSRVSRIGFSFLLLLAVGARGDAATLNVAVGGADADGCGTKTAPCRSISRAIANATPGDKILVGPGRYGDLDDDGQLGDPGEETGTFAVVTIDKPLIVQSVEGSATTLIDGGGLDLFGVEIAASGVVFGKAKKGFTVARAGRSGVFIGPQATNVTVSGIRSVRNTDAGFVSKSPSLVLRGNVAEANLGTGFTFAGAGSTFTACRATGNGGDGFAIAGENHVVKGNVASANGEAGFRFAGEANVLTGSVAAGNAAGLRVFSGSLTATGNSFFGNTIDGALVTAAGITLTKSNIFGNGDFGASNCGVRTAGNGSVTLDKICFGAPTGPGPDPADDVCGTITVLEIIEKVLKITPKVPL